MVFELYVEGELFFIAQIFKGVDLFIDFIDEYEANHLGDMSVVFDEDNSSMIIDFRTYEDYLMFEDAINNVE
ncbi:MAG: hypothetical protein MJ246_07445 [Clostridia bacterium]|nr:hypothetical protein [Clostridia bacterium]